MIQELFGTNVGIIGGSDQRSKLSSPAPAPAPAPAPVNTPDGSQSHSPAAATATTPENLRCPRCDSSNTKFCYYNNYNLTQPRHFCKTCRRYWTKGGALRNVPIGGGCRKNKSAAITAAVAKSSAAKIRSTASPEIGKSGLFSPFEPENPILWASSQNSHLLSLLRSNQNQNQNPNPNPNSHLPFESSESTNFNVRAFGMDNLGPMHVPLNSFYRNQAQAGQGIILGGDFQNNNGLQELYQRLRSTTSCYPDQNSPVVLGNYMGSGSSSSGILDSAPVAQGDQLGFWNSTVSWPADLPTANGAYP